MKNDQKVAKLAKKDKKVNKFLLSSYSLCRKWREPKSLKTLTRMTITMTKSRVMM